jgi:(2R)-3-sulfolactate dehydrogenase (NADP+)
MSVVLSPREAFEFAEAVCCGAGAGARMGKSLAEATVAAELHGKPIVGFAHLIDYCEALQAGRIDGGAEPRLHSPASALIACDVGGGIAQLGFDDAFESLVERARSFGIALLALSNSFTTGELGWYVRRLAERGLVALAASNGPALMKPPGAMAAVYCTNPIAFAAPGRDGAALVIDQSCSPTAYVAVRAAAERGEAIPAGWAVDAEGRPTTDAARALGGALLTFGGPRGANLALMVEVLAAGIAGAHWSLDAPPFDVGEGGPGIGLTVVAIAADLVGGDFAGRIEAQMERLDGLGVHIPGARGRAEAVSLPDEIVTQLRRYLGS